MNSDHQAIDIEQYSREIMEQCNDALDTMATLPENYKWSAVLREYDPIAYRTAVLDYVDSLEQCGVLEIPADQIILED